MIRKMKRRHFAGEVCEQIVYNVPGNVKNLSKYEPRPRFKNDEERRRHRERIARQNHARKFNANFTSKSLYSTLTCDDDNEIYTFAEAKAIIRKFLRRLQYAQPDALAFAYIGRGKHTHRIHFHMVSNNVPEECIRKNWWYGTVIRIEPLREHNYYEGKDYGQDYTGLANYLFDHWTEEQGGHHWIQIGKPLLPEAEEPTECKRDYSEQKPPLPPKGYRLVETQANQYGYLYFKYVKISTTAKKKRPVNRP